MKMTVGLICCCLLGAVSPLSASALSLVPPNVSAAPGTTAGWGYDIDNTTSNWMFLNDSFVAGELANAANGSYTDFVFTQSIVIDPNTDTGVVLFNSSPEAGVGEFSTSLSPVNSPITGTISIDFSLFTQDPNSPTFDPGSFVGSGTLQQSTQVNITPEPPALWLTLLSLAIFLVRFAIRRA